ncbi:MAG: M48 family metallopeptidase [Candidatus Marithrix sp.]
MSIKYVPKELPITENANVTRRHPLTNFIYLLSSVVIVSGIIFIALGYTASWLATKISPDNEKRVGDLLYNTIAETEIIDDRRIYYLDELLHDMLDTEENLRLPLTIHLLDTDIVNAAIMPGGHVLINTGLLREVKSENELAFVLAHELGHFQNKDPLKSLGRSLVIISALATVGIGTSSSSEGLSSIVSWTGELTILHYSRNQETEADEYGLARVVSHYGHGGHSLDFFNGFKEFEDEEFPQVSQYFTSHPQNQERIDYLNELAIQQGWDMNGEITPLPDWLHCPDMDEQQCEDDIFHH